MTSRRVLSAFDPTLVVVLHARVDSQAGEHDVVERGVGLPAATTVASEVLLLPQRGLTKEQLDCQWRMASLKAWHLTDHARNILRDKTVYPKGS